jgi:PAS domain S-box-containing protein
MPGWGTALPKAERGRAESRCENAMGESKEESKELVVLQGAVENTNEAFVTINQNHKVLFFNKAAERIFGFSREEVIGHDLDVIMSPRCSRDHHQAVERYVQTRKPQRIGHASEILATRKNGETFPAYISFSVSEVAGDTYFTGIVRDLTETKNLQERIIRSERLAALGQMVAEISHEIKNPLMMIGGFAKQLAKQSGEEKSAHKLKIIVSEVERLENLLKELRELYLPRTLTVEETSINDLLIETHELIKGECENKGIRVEISTGGASPLIRGDKAKLKQVFLNLVKNAIEAMEGGGRLSILSELKGNEVEIIIEDNGGGISDKDLGRIFSPFFTTKRHGTGLGLAISKSIIEEHPGGSISVESEGGKGTKFRISLPVIREKAENSKSGNGRSKR